MESFAFKPALLRGEVEYQLDDTGLHSDGAQIIAWHNVQGAAYVETNVNSMLFRRLDLTPTKGDLISLSVTTGPANPPTDPDAIAFLQLAAACLDRLASAKPDMLVAVGEYGRARKAMFAIGVISVLSTVIIVALAAFTGISSNRWAEGMVPIGILLLFGLGISWTFSPWRKVPECAAAPLAHVLRQLSVSRNALSGQELPEQ